MKNSYCLLFKTGQAELRALENTKFDKNNILPVVELTRGRKSKKDQIGKIEKRIDKIHKIFKNSKVCFDLTTSRDLSNEEIDELYDSSNGYSNWIDFLTDLNIGYNFKEILPTILVDTEDPFIETNLKKQVENLSKYFSTIVYRNSIADDGCYEDIQLLQNIINDSGVNFIFILDCEYVPSGAHIHIAAKIKTRINKIRNIIPKVNFVVASTSFPRFVSDVGKDPSDEFHLYELDIHKSVAKEFPDVTYGDYGSINPIRNDEIIMARGWIPRIDIPTKDLIYYYRERRGKERSYSDTYIEVAQQVVRHKDFPSKLKNNWGIQQVLSCLDYNTPGSSPNFWISVRMSIHIDQQLKRLLN